MEAQLAVAAGAALGAPARYLVDLGVRRQLGERSPWGTLAVNLLGSAAAGLAAGLGVEGLAASLVVVGFLASFTTASTLALELVERRDAPVRAALLLCLHVVPGLVLAAAGFLLGRSL